MIAVCLAVHRPDPGRLERQLASLRGPAGAAWSLVREDDEQGAAPGVRSSAATPASAAGRLVAPCDQDDVWHPGKLATLSAARRRRALAFCDLRIVDGDGRVLSPTYWTDRVATWHDLGAELRRTS